MKVSQGLGCVGAIAVCLATPAPGLTVAPTVQLNRYETDVCLNSMRGKPGNSLTVWSCDTEDPHQQYRLQEQRNGTLLLELEGSDACLRAPRPETGGQVELESCNAKDNKQQWQLVAIPHSEFNLIRLENSRYCLNAHRLENGAKIGLWDCDRFDNFQQWQLKIQQPQLHREVATPLSPSQPTRDLMRSMKSA